MKKQYSIIIPHKNSLLYLKRLLISIPKRDDIEIIIVDDNSNISNNLCGLSSDERIKIVSVSKDDSNGAGHARNVGLEYASGEWVLFADADDAYCDGFLSILDNYKHTDADVVYYDYNEVRQNKVIKLACSFINEKGKYDEDALRFRFTVPWNKIVRKSFLVNNSISFEECPVGNDAFYSFQVGYFARKIVVENKPLYNYYIHPNSIDHKKRNTADYYLCIFRHIYQYNDFFTFVGHNEWRRSVVSKFIAILIKKGFVQFLLSLKVYLQNLDYIGNPPYERKVI